MATWDGTSVGRLPNGNRPATPTIDPDAVRISRHALDRYSGRRHNGLPELGLRRLINRAASQPTPPLFLSATHGPHRRARAGGFVLIFDADMGTLVTLWRM